VAVLKVRRYELGLEGLGRWSYMALLIYRLKAMLGGEALHDMGLLFGKCYVGRSWLGYWGA
jgi:hypothetical protein